MQDCCNDGSKGTSFFCKIPFPDSNGHQEPLKVLITNNHAFSQSDINPGRKFEIYLNDKSIYIDKDRLTYIFEKPIDATFIDIKPNYNIDSDSYFELDENVFDMEKINIYLENTVYLLHNSGRNNAELSVGKIKGITLDTYKIKHTCHSQEGSSSSQ